MSNTGSRGLGANRVLGSAMVLLALGSVALAPPVAAAERPSDEQLLVWVKESLAADPRIVADDVSVSARAGIVTLRGSVPTLSGKRYGVLSTQRIRGVLGVVDQVEVESAVRPDPEIAAAVAGRLRGAPSIPSEEISVSSDHATVTLSGSVFSWSQRVGAEFLASEVRGVRDIENRLEVRTRSSRTDDEVQRDVAAALDRDVYLIDLPIVVRVVQGVVSLSGSVSSAYEKTRAGLEVGKVANVLGLNNEIRVEWWDDRSARTQGPPKRDAAELLPGVRDALEQDDRIDADGIVVGSVRRLVTLSGQVPTEQQRRLAEEDARNVVGVADVENELLVAFTARADDEVQRELAQLFESDSALHGLPIAVSLNSGAATLEGSVPSTYHRSHAGAIAARTRGVRAVENRLSVTGVSDLSDGLLAEEVLRRLLRDWRTGEIAGRIAVRVDDGIVTLSGGVDRWAERRSAGRIARATPGVRGVHNQLTVASDPHPPGIPGSKGLQGPPEWDPYWFDAPNLPWIA